MSFNNKELITVNDVRDADFCHEIPHNRRSRILTCESHYYHLGDKRVLGEEIHSLLKITTNAIIFLAFIIELCQGVSYSITSTK